MKHALTSIDTAELWIWPKTQQRLTRSNLRGNCTIDTVRKKGEIYLSLLWHCFYPCSCFRKPWTGDATCPPGHWCGRPPTRQRPCGTASQSQGGTRRTNFGWLDSISWSSSPDCSTSQPRLATSDQKGVQQFASSEVGSQRRHMQRSSNFSKLSSLSTGVYFVTN